MEQRSSHSAASDAPSQRQRARLRLAILLLCLSFVSMWASSRVTKHKLLTTWRATLQVSVVLLGPGGVPPEKRALIESRLGELDRLIAREFSKYQPSSKVDPVKFELAGAVGVQEPPPKPPEDGNYFERALHAWKLSRYIARVNRQAELNTALYDTRIYVMLEPASAGQARSVEGLGAKNGEVGFVTSHLDASTLDLTLIAIGHEFLHTVGATDKYDEHGHTASPEFVAEPERHPLFPQRFAEIMVGEIATGEATGRLPDTLDEVAVGPVTAREVRWLKDVEPAPAVATHP